LEPEVFGNLIKQIETGAIAPVVAATYPLKDIGAAQSAFAEKAYTGKIVLTVA
jgi:NADPH:quinone reductase-like Zn-dependent oxidoreductase